MNTALLLCFLYCLLRIPAVEGLRWDCRLRKGRKTLTPNDRVLPTTILYQTRRGTREIGEKQRIVFSSRVRNGDPEKLLDFLIAKFPGAKRNEAKKWLQFRSIAVNGEPQAKWDLSLQTDDRVSLLSGRLTDLSKKSSGLPLGLRIIHEDEHIIVVEKPHDLPLTLSTALGTDAERTGKNAPVDSDGDTLLGVLHSYLGKRSGSSGKRVIPAHYVDGDASGLVVLAKDPKTRDNIASNWNSYGKVYTLLCEGVLVPPQGTISTYVVEASKKGPVLCSDISGKHTGPDTKLQATSYYRTVRSAIDNRPQKASISLLEVSMDTDRRDQLRTQFAFINHTICGDHKYHSAYRDMKATSPENDMKPSAQLDVIDPLRRLALHFSELRMVHPVTKESITLFSDPPPSFDGYIDIKLSEINSWNSLDINSYEDKDDDSMSGISGIAAKATAGPDSGKSKDKEAVGGNMPSKSDKQANSYSGSNDSDGDGDNDDDDDDDMAFPQKRAVKMVSLSDYLGTDQGSKPSYPSQRSRPGGEVKRSPPRPQKPLPKKGIKKGR